MSPYLIIAALLLALGMGGAGYIKGRHDNEAQHIADALETAQAQAAAQSRILAAEQTARLLTQALEDQANAEPPVSPACLPRSRVMRLQKYAAP